MIYIISNGRAYSDHSLFFVNCCHILPEQIEAAVKLCSGPESAHGSKWIICGSSQYIEWTNVRLGTISFHQMIDVADYEGGINYWEDGSPEDIAEAKRLMAILPSDIIFPDSLIKLQKES